MDTRTVDTMVTNRFGAPPGARRQSLLAITGGNPFHVRVLLDDLRPRGLLSIEDGMLTTSATRADAPESVQAGAPTSPCSTRPRGTCCTSWRRGDTRHDWSS